MLVLQGHISRLEDVMGIKLYAVGGCVRDFILSRPVKDYDFTCKEKPEDIHGCITKMGKRVYTIGKRFGTLAFKDDQLGMIEITSFRRESYTPANRKPTVDFVDKLETDLSRRDFTMNALAVDSDGTIHDMFNGLQDLSEGIVKCVGNPAERFEEDPLRILRCVRFALEMRFDIHESIVSACPLVTWKLLRISKERIVAEIEKMFAVSILDTLVLLNDLHILGVLFPEVHLGNGDILTLFKEKSQSTYNFAVGTASVLENARGWAVILEYIATLLSPKSHDHDWTQKRNIIYKDLVSKYAMHLKFSNMRTSLLLDWKMDVIDNVRCAH